MSKSKFKAMMIDFFDIQGVIYIDWVPEGQIVNQVASTGRDLNVSCLCLRNAYAYEILP